MPLAAGVGTLIGACISLAGLITVGPLRGVPYVPSFRGATSGIDVVLANGDGQAYAAIARHPLPGPAVARAFQSAAEAAYREQRPLAAWIAALVRNVPIGLLVVAIVGSGLAVGAVAELIRRRGGDPVLGALVAITPGSVVASRLLMPDLFAFGLAAAGLVVRRPAVRWLLLAAAVLTRETTAIIPLVLGAFEFCEGQRRRAILHLSTVVPWVAWLVVIRLRMGIWPTAAAGHGRLAPLVGVGGFRPSVGAVTTVLLLAAVVGAAIWRAWPDPLAWVLVGYGAFALFMGSDVWRSWQDFSRPVIPALALGVVLLATPHVSSAPSRASEALVVRAGHA